MPKELLSTDCSHSRQRIVLNGQLSNWSHIEAGVSQGSILGPLLFLVYINDRSEGLFLITKLFADDASLFSVVHDSQTASASLNGDLTKTFQRTYQWKILFNPDTSKKAQEIVFCCKKSVTNHVTIYINIMPIIKENVRKHLGLFLDVKQNFLVQVNGKIKKLTYHCHVLH